MAPLLILLLVLCEILLRLDDANAESIKSMRKVVELCQLASESHRENIKMSLKLIIICATLTIVSCARIDQEQLNRQAQQDMVQQQNEEIREHQRVESQQRQEQIRELQEQIRRQEQLIRDQEQQNRDKAREIANVYFTAQPQFLPAPIHFFTIPSSLRNFEQIDDSNYNFAYAIRDQTTGDVKSQQEVRRGDQVKGQYTMMDSDGYQRIVDYRADDKNGFDAEVRREPISAAFVAPQLPRIEGPNNYFYHSQQPTAYISAQPAIFSSTSVTRNDDGQRNQYTSTTSTF